MFTELPIFLTRLLGYRVDQVCVNAGNRSLSDGLVERDLLGGLSRGHSLASIGGSRLRNWTDL